MKVPFQKWHGCKNNFIVIFASVNQTYLIPSLQREAHKLCNKDGSSIGADGILVLEYPETIQFEFAPKKLAIINSDGSIAKNCGNGLRCAALACYKRAKDQGRDSFIPDSFELAVEEHLFLCRFMQGSSGGLPFLSISMAKPQLDKVNPWHQEAVSAVKKVFATSKQAPKLQEVHTCTLSNEHIVVGVEHLDDKFLKEIGSALQQGYSWDGINVHLAVSTEEDPKQNRGPKGVISDESMVYKVNHYERGCGPTAACGSGASSVAAAAFAEDFLSENDCVIVKMPGGSVFIRQKSKNSPLEMIGPAEFVFSGELEL